jgi:hypothetical protein
MWNNAGSRRDVCGERRDFNLIEARDVVVLRPKRDVSVGAKGPITRSEQRLGIK